MNYDNIYKQNSHTWGDKPNKLLAMICDDLESGSYFLDLGCGQGRDSLFMAKNGFQVTAVDSSSEGINDLNGLAMKAGVEMELICKSIKEFEIESNKYSIINIFNTLQFLKKDDALEVIDNVKNKLRSGGHMIIAGFTKNDPLFKFEENKDRGFFELGELKNLFSDFEMIFYRELIIDDLGHAGFEEPHEHGVVRMVAKKS